MADIQVSLCAILSDEDLAMLEGVHGAGIDVDVRVQLLHRHTKPAGPKKPSET